MGFFGKSPREKEEEQLFNKMEERIARIIARGKDPSAYNDIVIYLLYKEDKNKKCSKCNKRLIAPNYKTPQSFGGKEFKEITDKLFARAIFCVQCERFFCEGCAFEQGRNLGKKRLICPKCQSDLGSASKL